jgi:hypothetical protein
LFLAVLGLIQLACVGGHIPPSIIQFQNVVPYTPPDEGGWKVAQVLILLNRISPVFPESATCDIEVGVPERNLKGWVLDEVAQVEVAKAADEAARIVLRERLPTALACAQFRKHLQGILTHPEFGTLPGARVTGFQRQDVPRATFP